METELALLAVVLLVAGFLSGIVAGLLGVGGGMILVPVLFQTFIFFRPSGTFANSYGGCQFNGDYLLHRHFVGAQPFSGAARLMSMWSKAGGMFIAIGALSGAVAARFIAPAGLKIIFATLALTMAARMLLNKNPGEAGASSISLVVQKGLASLVGFFSALMGIGGGTLSVPLLNASGRDVLRAVGTSSVFGVFIAVPAALGFMAGGWSLPDLPPLSFGYVNLLAVLAIIPTSMLAAPLGARLAHRLTKKALNNIFAGFLIVSGGRMLIAIFI